ncbi:ABC transporter substrate-binding protein [Salibacterium salarium]|uniref:ABC transporter substrate-binding protein n=1 Tax=Salibacterium salarium TaxID=284579 RepID=A0A3R9QJX6_9BACI|nr:ABC transporter substrate-binding protein [Salibacterium salarium]RSL32058.1 ABC transporter substrate-binding protein [Salibacterium salarium]
MKKWLYSTLLSVSLIMITGCGDGQEEQSSEEDTATENGESENNESAEETEFPVEITDATGETLTIEEEPERIVSTVPSNTEIAFALGLEEEIVGVTDFANYPEEATEKESVGGMDFNVETLLSMEPDLVLADASSLQQAESGLEQVEEAGIDVLVVNNATSFEDAYDSMEMIGQASGKTEEAASIVSNMKEDMEEMQEQAQDIPEEEQKKVWMEVQGSPELYTTGQGTFVHEMLETINAENAAAAEEGWVKYSEEEAVALNPDVIITTYGDYSESDPAEEIKARSGWTNVPAVENNEIYDVNNDTVSRPGPRLVEGVRNLAELVYPDVFAE